MTAPPKLKSFCFGEHGVNHKDQKLIVQLHNEIRRNIAQGKLSDQPKGKGFENYVSTKKNMVYKNNLFSLIIFQRYDKRLADHAQRIADQCEFEHKQVKDSKQIIYYRGQTKIIWLVFFVHLVYTARTTDFRLKY